MVRQAHHPEPNRRTIPKFKFQTIEPQSAGGGEPKKKRQLRKHERTPVKQKRGLNWAGEKTKKE